MATKEQPVSSLVGKAPIEHPDSSPAGELVSDTPKNGMASKRKTNPDVIRISDEKRDMIINYIKTHQCSRYKCAKECKTTISFLKKMEHLGLMNFDAIVATEINTASSSSRARHSRKGNKELAISESEDECSKSEPDDERSSEQSDDRRSEAVESEVNQQSSTDTSDTFGDALKRIMKSELENALNAKKITEDSYKQLLERVESCSL
jgi:hypothetical protein